jgi:adenylate cyclase class IV
MAHYEIEIKSLLGEAAAAESLKTKMAELDPAFAHVSSNQQLNHYFVGGNMEELYRIVERLFDADEQAKLQKIVEKGTDFSVRTRQRDTEVLLVVKASVDAGTSENTISRLEFEEPVAISLDELDALVIEAGFDYQAKWSREREEFTYKDANVCIDYNAGYGYLAEFEKITDDEERVPEVKAEIEALMAELGVVELQQDRLARMFEHYNANWRDYYGTTKTFIIE